MDEKISLKSVDQYAINYANQLADSFFSKQEKISGPEILSLCEVKQVNLFVISDLLSVWQQESQKLKSPYFDYEAKPVLDIINQFQNTLSNHILIGKADFLPMLKRAVSKTLYLILAPYDFYADTLEGKGYESLQTQALKNKVKYIKVNQAPLEKLLAHLQEKKIDTLTGKEAFALLDHILEEVNFTPEDFESHISLFNKILPVDIESFYGIQPKTATESKSKVETQTKPLVAVEPIESKATATLADNLAKQKTVKLKESLTINQKFMFTKILFHGDFEIFSEAIDKLDRLDNLTQAMKFIEDGYPDWDIESEEYEEFIEILQNRFS